MGIRGRQKRNHRPLTGSQALVAQILPEKVLARGTRTMSIYAQAISYGEILVIPEMKDNRLSRDTHEPL